MTPAEFSDGRVRLHLGDCLAILRTLPDESIDAVITDPPYGLADHKPDAVVAALTAWASGGSNSHDCADGALDRPCDACGAAPGEACDDFCVGLAAHLDETRGTGSADAEQ